MTPIFFVVVVLASFSISAVLVGLSRKLAFRVDALDRPDGGRKTQELPIPRLGGVAIAVALTIVWSTASLLVLGGSGVQFIVGIMIPAIVMAVVGLMDDRRNLNPWLRLLAQALMALVALVAGTSIDLTPFPIVNGVIFILWVMIVVNSINLLDNSDGLAGSTVLVSATASGIIALVFGQFLVAALALALAGAAAGFLIFNWHPATVYLGDSGAYFLGFLLAVVVVRLKPIDLPAWQAALIAILLVALPLFDTCYVIARRLRKGIHPFTAGRDHLSHSVQRRGMTVPRTVILLEALLVTTSLAAVLIAWRAD